MSFEEHKKMLERMKHVNTSANKIPEVAESISRRIKKESEE